jgi:hypothetical protein
MALSTPNRTTDAAGDAETITAPRARQAYKGRRILWILLVSLAAVVIAFLIAYGTNNNQPAAAKLGSGHVTNPAAAQMFHAPEPQPKNPG